jgi:hypothetical protein
MRLLITFILSLSSTAWAGTQTIFSKDGSKATILMLAFSTNPDAVAFNDVMNIPAEDNNGKAVKRFEFIEDSGVKGLDAICAFSKLVSTTGTCTLVFHNEGKATWDAAHASISYRLTGAEAARLAALFILPLAPGEVFHSSDNRFVISVGYASGAVNDFYLKYGAP